MNEATTPKVSEAAIDDLCNHVDLEKSHPDPEVVSYPSSSEVFSTELSSLWDLQSD